VFAIFIEPSRQSDGVFKSEPEEFSLKSGVPIPVHSSQQRSNTRQRQSEVKKAKGKMMGPLRREEEEERLEQGFVHGFWSQKYKDYGHKKGPGSIFLPSRNHNPKNYS